VSYSAFTDAAGGSGSDSFTVAIGHWDTEAQRSVLDVVRERRPRFSPQDVIQEYSELLRAYGIHEVMGDAFAGEFVAEQFQECGISYRRAEHSKSEIYANFLPILNAGRCELLDNQKLIVQLAGLERRVARGSGRPNIDHGPAAHDDLSNAVAGVLTQLSQSSGLAVWARLGRVDAAPASVAPVASEPPAPDQLFDNQAPPGSARYRQLAQRRNAQPLASIVAAGGEEMTIMEIPKDLYLSLPDGHGASAIVLVPEGRIEVPTRLADHWYLKNNGARIADGAET
jgi:hypothetical protein